MEVEIFANDAAVAEAAAALIGDAVNTNGRTIGLAGGSTPRATYERLPALQLDWSDTALWVSDERWVPSDDPDSNVRMVREAFVDAVGAHLIAPDFGLGDPAAAAEAYTQALDEAMGDGPPDLVLLGIGDDGHTASLFPGTVALEATGPRVVQNWVADKKVWRLTATFDLLWSASHVVFIVTGEAKAAVMAEIIDDARPYPAQRVASGASGRVTWMLDSAAASRLAVA